MMLASNCEPGVTPLIANLSESPPVHISAAHDVEVFDPQFSVQYASVDELLHVEVTQL